MNLCLDLDLENKGPISTQDAPAMMMYHPIQFSCKKTAVGGASDRHTADAGSIPRCGKELFSQSQLSVQTLVRIPPCAITCINMCAHVKDPVVHIRVRWIMETRNHPGCTVGWIARRCRSWLSPGKQSEFFMGEIPMGQIHLFKKKLYEPSLRP